MNVIKVKVNFSQRTIVRQGVDLTEGDYNSTKIVFDFDTDEGTKIFQMKNPSDEIVLEKEIINNEVILTGEADVTTIHNEKTYVKYLDSSSNVYWYNSDDEELYDSSWNLDTTTSLDTLTKQTENASIFTETGSYIYEISLYNDDSRLTSASDKIKVKKKQIGDDSETAVIYKPVFDELISEFSEAIGEIDNIDITSQRVEDGVEISITNKDGESIVNKVNDGAKGDTGNVGADAKINGVNTLNIEAGTNITLDQQGSTLTINSTGGGTSDYEELENQPKVNNVTLIGNKTSSDLGLITNAVDDLVNYYKKSETFTKQEVNNLISAITTMDIQVVQTLPTEDISTTTIYLVPKTTAETNDAYDEYIYVSNAWEHIGSTEVDLTNYVTNTDYAGPNKVGVIRTNPDYGTSITSVGALISATKTYQQYQDTTTQNMFISKGTLENVITGKGLVSNTDYATSQKGGVIKCFNSDGLTTNNGTLVTATKTYAQYKSSGNWIFVGKGTLENVIEGKELDLKQLSTFDNTKTQVLKNINGTLTWVDE